MFSIFLPDTIRDYLEAKKRSGGGPQRRIQASLSITVPDCIKHCTNLIYVS